MKSIFVPSLEIVDKNIILKDSYFINYIKNVLRLNKYNFLKILSNNINYETQIISILKKEIVLEIKKAIPIHENEKNIILIQSLIKLERFEIMLEKAIEIGVSQIIPLITSRTKIQDVKWDNKLKRFNKIILKALTQSKQNIIPEIKNPIKLEDLEITSDMKFFFDIDAKIDFFSSDRKLSKNLAIFIGPEGGISKEEKLILKNKGFESYSLNLPVLRSETAAIIALAIVNMRLNNE